MRATKQHWVGAGVGAAVIALTVGVASCGIGGDKVNEPFQDAPRTAKADNGAAQVIEMPDGFNNIASKCVGGVRYAVTYHSNSPYGSVSMLGGDNGCPKP